MALNRASAPFPSLSLSLHSVCVHSCVCMWASVKCERVGTCDWLCVCVRGGWVELCCRTAGYPMRAGLFCCVLCVYSLVYIVTSFTLLPLYEKLRDVIQAYRYIHIYFLEPERKCKIRNGAINVFYFLVSKEADWWEDCGFSFVSFRQSSGMLNYTSTVNSCLAGFGVCLSLSLSLSGEWITKIWKTKKGKL